MISSKRTQLSIACAASALGLFAGLSTAQAETGQQKFEIEAQPLSKAIWEFSRQSNIDVIAPSHLIRGKQSKPVGGHMAPEAALNQLLNNSGLVISAGEDGSLTIQEASQEQGDTEDSKEESESEGDTVDEEIVVTGSRIAKASSQLAANVIVLDGKSLLASGETTLEGALRQLPQNIFGATPVGAAVFNSGMSFNGALNISGASSINLRGLGSESTLILIDGRRIGKSGVFGGISDITGIPLRSVERVEIMLDGASSIYGSDAVGGVVNVITKKDFEGGEATYEYASPQLGGFSEHVLSITGGVSWNSGQARGTFERFQRNNLDGGERPEYLTDTSDGFFTNPGRISPSLSSTFYRYEGNIVTFSELLNTYTFSEVLAMRGNELIPLDVLLPPGQDGTNLTRDDLIFVEKSGNTPAVGYGISLNPKQLRNTLRLGFDQQLQLFGQELALAGDFAYSERETYAADGEFNFTVDLPADYPGNPLPGNSMSVYWNMPGFADVHHQTEQTVTHWNLSLDGNMGKDWRWNLSAGQSRDTMDSLYFNEALKPWLNASEIQALLDDGLNVLASDLFEANSIELLQGLIAPPRATNTVNTENRFEITANGVLFSLPGGNAHVSAGSSWRQEILETGSDIRLSQSPFDPREPGSVPRDSMPLFGGIDEVKNSRVQRSFFTELLLPVVGTNNAVTGIQRFNLTGSARYDSYQMQGSDSTWSLGMIWNPINQVTVKARHSTSYVVPTFRDQLAPTTIVNHTENPRFEPLGLPYYIVDREENLTGEIDYLGYYIGGGNPDLKPETASSLTAGIEITPEILPGFTFSATWHQTEYTNRIGSPPQVELTFVPGFGTGIYSDIDYATEYGNTMYRADDGSLAWDARTKNTAFVEIAGIDYLARYNRDTEYGHFLVTVNIAYKSKHDTQQNPGDEVVNQVDNVTFQSRSVFPKYRYSTQLHWYNQGFSASLNASTASKTVSEGELWGSVLRRIAKYPLRMDLRMSYDLDEGNLFTVPGWLQGTVISLSVPQLFNDTAEYEIIRVATGEPYEVGQLNPNVTDPVGRMFNLSLTKRF